MLLIIINWTLSFWSIVYNIYIFCSNSNLYSQSFKVEREVHFWEAKHPLNCSQVAPKSEKKF